VDALNREKQALRDLAVQHLGMSAKTARVFVSEGVTRDQLDAVLALPVDATDYVPLQDPLTGALYWMAGVDSWFDDSAPLF